MKRLLISGITLLFASVLAHAAKSPTEFTLDNGLKVIVQEDHRAPVVVAQVWYRIGSSYEPDGITGISHALEHMMFKGTQKVPVGEFSRIVTLFGGSNNAFTSDDYTGYYQVYSVDKLELALELEADRMQNLVLDPKEFASEIKVVMEERRLRTDDKPQAKAFERYQTLLYPSSPTRVPTVGWMRDLESMTIEDLQQWYNTWYAPNNATVVIVGAVNPADVKTLVNKYFAAIPSRKLPRTPRPVEMPEPGQRESILKLPGKVPALFMGFNVPSLTTAPTPAEAYALRMMVGVLDEGVSARLETRIIREQKIAAAVSSSYGLFSRGDAAVTISAIPNEGKTLVSVRDAILAEIERLKVEPIAPEELQRVYAGIVASDVFKRDSISAQANTLGALDSIGVSWRELEALPANLKAVTPEQIQAAAKKYLVPQRMAVLQLLPEDAPSTTPVVQAEGVQK